MTAFVKYASVILEISIHKTLDYGVTTELSELVKPGVKVEVPIRGRMHTGYVFNLKDKSDFSSVQPISRVLSNSELISKDLFELSLWMSKYYCVSLRQVLRSILPASVRKKDEHKQQLFVMRAKTREELREICVTLRTKHPAQAEVLDVMLQVNKGVLLTELLEQTEGSRSPVDSLVKKGYLIVDTVRVDRSPLINEDYFQTKPKKLNTDQDAILTKIRTALSEDRFETHLIYGITGSGKTEVYLQAIDHALKSDKGTIMLVPEISLTMQTIERFRSRFEGQIAILHHRLSQGERYDEWHKIKRGDAKIVIGARSAIFSPMPNLGLIIVDEEHENSYKQTDESPCYHARNVAVMRGKLTNATVLLGSATPSLESYYNATSGKYCLSILPVRAGNQVSLPKVTIVDMKKEFEKAKGYTTFSEKLIDSIKKRKVNGEQTILFLNRRGYHTTLLCKQCNHVIKCEHCDVSLTFHLGENHLSCHLCGYAISPPPNQCPICKESTMKFKGIGTEQVQKALHAILPDIRTLRIDADTTKHKGSHQKLFREFATGKADVVIGTQMIAKGLHFPQVTLVGVLNSDSSLNIPDFRASETVFQLITQVSGRSGRGAMPGEVIVQTCLPEHSTIVHAANQDFAGFYSEEIAVRKLFNYPPFTQMVKIAFSGDDANKTKEFCEKFRSWMVKELPPSFEINPVVAAGYAKVKGKYRFQFLVKGANIYMLNQALDKVQQQVKVPSSIRMLIDVDPMSTFF